MSVGVVAVSLQVPVSDTVTPAASGPAPRPEDLRVLSAFAAQAATALGITDPRGWDRSAWAADLLPHLAYGLATALTFDALADGRR